MAPGNDSAPATPEAMEEVTLEQIADTVHAVPNELERKVESKFADINRRVVAIEEQCDRMSGFLEAFIFISNGVSSGMSKVF